MKPIERDLDSLFDRSAKRKSQARYDSQDEAAISRLISAEYRFFKLDDADCDPAAVALAAPVSAAFLKAARQGGRGIAAAATALAPKEWAWNRAPELSGRTKDIVNGLRSGKKLLLSPFTGELVETDVSLGPEWYLYSNGDDYCLCSQMSDIAWHVFQETVWLFLRNKTVLIVNNGLSTAQISTNITQRLLLCLERFDELQDYIHSSERKMALCEAFCPHMGHNLWNILSGWANLFKTGTGAAIDRLLLYRKHAVFGPLEELFPEEAPANKIVAVNSEAEILDMMIKDNLLLFQVKDQFISNDLADRILRRARQSCDSEFIGRANAFKRECYPIVIMTIRLDNRSWHEQKWGYINLFKRLKRDFPHLGLVIHGMSKDTLKGWTTAWMPEDEERALADEIEARLNKRLPVINCVGGPFAESLVLSDLADVFVAPIGSGMALYKWIANKPGLAFSNRLALDRANPPYSLRVFDRFRPDIKPARYLSPDQVHDIAIEDRGGANRNNFSLDWRVLLAEVETLLGELFPDGRRPT